MKYDNLDYDRFLKKLLKTFFITYRGYQIERTEYGFIALETVYDTEKQAKEAIDKAYNSLRNSIKP